MASNAPKTEGHVSKKTTCNVPAFRTPRVDERPHDHQLSPPPLVQNQNHVDRFVPSARLASFRCELTLMANPTATPGPDPAAMPTFPSIPFSPDLERCIAELRLERQDPQDPFAFDESMIDPLDDDPLDEDEEADLEVAAFTANNLHLRGPGGDEVGGRRASSGAPSVALPFRPSVVDWNARLPARAPSAPPPQIPDLLPRADRRFSLSPRMKLFREE